MNEIEINGHTETYYQGKKCTYVIGALLDKDNKYSMTWLEFSKNHGMNNEKTLDSWDNIDYLINIYNNVIKPWVVNKEVKESTNFSNLLKEDFIELEDFEGIYALFNKAYNLKILNND